MVSLSAIDLPGPRSRALVAAAPQVSGPGRSFHLAPCPNFEPGVARSLLDPHPAPYGDPGPSKECACTETLDSPALSAAKLLWGFTTITRPPIPTSPALSLLKMNITLVVGYTPALRAEHLWNLTNELRAHVGDEAEELAEALTRSLTEELAAAEDELIAWQNSDRAREVVEVRARVRADPGLRDDPDVTALLDATGPAGPLARAEIEASTALPTATHARLLKVLAAALPGRPDGRALVHPCIHKPSTPMGPLDALTRNVSVSDAMVRYKVEGTPLYLLPASLVPLVRWPADPSHTEFEVTELGPRDTDAVLEVFTTLFRDTVLTAGSPPASVPEVLAHARALA